MKNLNKVLAMLVVFMMVVTTVAFAGSFTDVADTSSYSTAIEVGTDLDLFKGYEDGTFAPEGEITRAEFAAIVVRLKGHEEQANGAKAATMFADVPADHWAAGYINLAVQFGIINGYGDGNFGPEDLVEYQDAVTMMVRALGYEPAIGAAGYPAGYLTKAGELGLTSKVNGTNGVAINRGAVAQIVFNSLDAPLMTQSGYGTFTQYIVNDGRSTTTGEDNGIYKSILSENYGIVKFQAIVNNSSDTKLQNAMKVDTVDINILKTANYGAQFDMKAANNMKVGDTDALNYVGKKVIIFASFDEFESGNQWTVESIYELPISESVVVDLHDVITLPNDYIGDVEYYNENDKKVTISVGRDDDDDDDDDDERANVYINGVELDNIDNEDLYADTTLLTGKVEFALLNPSNSSYDYDTIYIDAAVPFVVDEVKASTGSIKNKIPDTLIRTIYFNEEDGDVKATLTAADGSAMEWKDLNEFDVLMVKYVESGKDLYTAQVVDNKVSGTVTSISGVKETITRSVKVDGVEYEVATFAETDKEIKIGDEGTYYLDSMNKIVYVDKSTIKSGNYGYVVATDEVDGLLAGKQVKMVTRDNALVIYNFAKKIKVTGDDRIMAGANKLDPDAEDGVASAFGTYTNVSIDNIDVEELEGMVITYKVNSANEITAIEIPYDGDNADMKEDNFSLYNTYTNNVLNVLAMTAYDAEDMSFKVGSKRLYLSANTVVFNIGETNGVTDPEETEVVALNNLVDDQSLTGAYIYDVDEDDMIGCVFLTVNNSIVGNNDNATFVVKYSTSTDDEGDEITIVQGYKDLEPVEYTCKSEDLANPAALVGKLVVPVYNANGSVKDFVLVTNGSDHGTEAGDFVGISGEIVKVDGRALYLNPVVGTEPRYFKPKASANVYVYDASADKANAKVKFSIGEAVAYFDFDDETLYDLDGDGDKEEDEVLNLYVDKDDHNNNVTVYMYEAEGDIVDIVYYIHD